MMEAFDSKGNRTWFGWAVLGFFVTLWFTISALFPLAGIIFMAFHFTALLIDVSMNGPNSGSDWLPINLVAFTLALAGTLTWFYLH